VGKLHPLDLKTTLADFLEEFLKPVVAHFTDNPEFEEASVAAYPKDE
jgi:hypothetical protein